MLTAMAAFTPNAAAAEVGYEETFSDENVGDGDVNEPWYNLYNTADVDSMSSTFNVTDYIGVDDSKSLNLDVDTSDASRWHKSFNLTTPGQYKWVNWSEYLTDSSSVPMAGGWQDEAGGGGNRLFVVHGTSGGDLEVNGGNTGVSLTTGEWWHFSVRLNYSASEYKLTASDDAGVQHESWYPFDNTSKTTLEGIQFGANCDSTYTGNMFFDNISVEGDVSANAGPTYSNRQPADDATGISSATLSADVSDPDGDSVTVTFYNAISGDVIGTDSVTNDTASITWDGLTSSSSYEWNFTMNDGTNNITADTWTFTTGSTTTYVYTEDFEDDVTGEKPSAAWYNISLYAKGWDAHSSDPDLTPAGPYEAINEVKTSPTDSGNQAMYYDTQHIGYPDKTYLWGVNFKWNATVNIQNISFDYYNPGGDYPMWLMGFFENWQDSIGNLGEFQHRADGTEWAWNKFGATDQTIASDPNFDQWYHVNITFDYAAQTATVWIDGTEEATVDFPNDKGDGTVDGLRAFGLTDHCQNDHSVGYLDNVTVVSEEPIEGGHFASEVKRESITIGSTSATVQGRLYNDRGEACMGRFIYGRDVSYTYHSNSSDALHAGDAQLTDNQSISAGTFSDTLTDLEPGTRYNWWPAVHHPSDEITNFTYGSGNGPHYVTADDRGIFLTHPEDVTDLAASVSGTDIDISWTHGAGYDTTMLLHSTTEEPSSPDDAAATVIYNGTSNSYTHSDVSDGTHYYSAWEYCSNDTDSSVGTLSQTSELYDTTTVTYGDNTAPEISNPSPIDGATGVVTDPTLSVDIIDDEGDSVTVTFINDSDGSTIGTDTVNNDTASVTWNGLSNGVTKNWHVEAADGGATNTSDTWTFTTTTMDNTAPSITNPSPADGDTGVSTSPTLSVNISDADGDSVTVTFIDESDGTTIGTDTVSSSGTATTTWSGLNNAETYTWSVTADDGVATTTAGPWTFTTEGTDGNTVPDISSPEPTDGQTDVATDLPLSVDVTDADGDAVTVSFYNADNGTLIGTDTVTNDTATVTWSGLDHSTTYEWFAVGDDGTDSVTAGPWNFTTAGVAPPPGPTDYESLLSDPVGYMEANPFVSFLAVLILAAAVIAIWRAAERS